MKFCPECKYIDTVSKVIFIGFPMRYCARCKLVFGFWSFICSLTAVIPNSDRFVFMQYIGSYWKALRNYFRNEPNG